VRKTTSAPAVGDADVLEATVNDVQVVATTRGLLVPVPHLEDGVRVGRSVGDVLTRRAPVVAGSFHAIPWLRATSSVAEPASPRHIRVLTRRRCVKLGVRTERAVTALSIGEIEHLPLGVAHVRRFAIHSYSRRDRCRHSGRRRLARSSRRHAHRREQVEQRHSLLQY